LIFAEEERKDAATWISASEEGKRSPSLRGMCVKSNSQDIFFYVYTKREN